MYLSTSTLPTANELGAMLLSHPWLAVGLVLVVYASVSGYLARRRSWVDCPTLGHSDPILSYASLIGQLWTARMDLRKAYVDHYDNVCKIPSFDRWLVMVCGKKLVEEVSNLPDEVASLFEASRVTLELDYTMGHRAVRDPWHHAIIKNQFNRALDPLFPDIVDEVRVSCADYIDVGGRDVGGGWVSAPALDTMLMIVTRGINRLLVGLPLCRNEEFNDIAKQYVVDVVVNSQVIGKFPLAFKPIIGYIFSTKRRRERARKLVYPLIEERLQTVHENKGDWESVHTDFLTWLLQNCPDPELDWEDTVERIMSLQMAAIHTTAMVAVYTLYHFANYPQYIEELREEMSKAVEKEGWTKAAMNSCRKLDSYIKEVMRMKPLTLNLLNRVVMQDFTLSNGTFIPKGTYITTPVEAMAYDANIFGEDADRFDPWRFMEGNKRNMDPSLKQQVLSTNPQLLIFGTGRHACPGRVFAITEVKAILAHVLLNYDVKFPPGGEHVMNEQWVGVWSIPNHHAQVLFKRRD